MDRRTFLRTTTGCATATLLSPQILSSQEKPSAKLVRTVLGKVAPEKLGVTMMHEHLPIVDWSELFETPMADFEPIRAQVLSDLEQAIKVFRSALGENELPGAMVECTPIRVGRYPRLLVDIARQFKLHLIACTSFWGEAMAPQHPWAVRMSIEKEGYKKIAQLYIREIEQGMEDPSGKWGEKFTDIPVGIIKVATSSYLRPSERACHMAAAIACRETGCPITTHTTDGGGLEEAELLLAQKVQPEKIIIGHQGNMDDRQAEEAYETHLRLADQGCFVQFDRVGGVKYPIPKIVRQIKRLVEAGHTERILVGHDHVPYLYRKFALSDKPLDGWQANRPDFSVVPAQLTPALLKAGVSPAQVRAILVDNPARVLAF